MNPDLDCLESIVADMVKELRPLRFGPPVTHVYNPLEYAQESLRQYHTKFASTPKDVVFLGMNPGPWGMAQTGVPFGEVAAVRDWMGLFGEVKTPTREHEKRKIQGLACTRSEVSGARLWGWAQQRFASADAFFEKHFVTNYCPLIFMEEGARNITPDKLPAFERAPLDEACDVALAEVVHALQPRIVIGVGVYAEKQAARVCAGMDVQIGRILHPSPASPIANRGWAPQAEKQLEALGVL